MAFPRRTESTGHAGARPRGRVHGGARSHPRFATAVSIFCAVAAVTTLSASAIPAGAAATPARAMARAGLQSPATGHRSGLPWLSGAYLASETPKAASAFGTWRHRKLDAAVVWPREATWAELTDPAWLYRRWKGSPYVMILTLPMLPTGVRGVSLRACANGAYTSHWRQFGRNIRASGLGSSIIRLGWEFNGKWFPWPATNPRVWAQCWRRIVTAARSTAPALSWDWNVNRGVSSALANPARAYPGNAYVNTVGIDSYDWWPAATARGGWNEQLNGPQGLNYWLAFAKAHGKKLAVPEWGNARYGRSSGGDDPGYVKDMRAFFSANSRYLAFEAICQAAIGSYRDGRLMPRAAAVYKTDF
jgi:hypothetical protein